MRLALLLPALALAACAKPDAPAAPSAPSDSVAAVADTAVMTLTKTENDKDILIDQGQVLAIELDANATTGYEWVVADSAALAPALAIDTATYTAGDAGNPPRVGVGGTYTLRLRGVAPGMARVRLDYRRPFEPKETPAADTFAVPVTVRPAAH